MKINTLILSAVLTASAFTHDNSTCRKHHQYRNYFCTRRCCQSGTVGKQMGGSTGAMIGSGGGGAGATVSADRRDRNGAIIGGALGGAGGYTVGKNMGGTVIGYIGRSGWFCWWCNFESKVSEDRRYDDERYDRRYNDRGYNNRGGYRSSHYRHNDRSYYSKDNGRHLGHYKNGKRH